MQRSTAPQGLAIARALVRAKIVNMRGSRAPTRSAARPGLSRGLEHHARRAETAPSLDTLLGIEGAATALYFSAWPEMISARAGELTLAGRTRRPPQDEVNALLSYAYAVLAGECLAACAAAGLDPAPGVPAPPARRAAGARPRSDGAVPAGHRRAGDPDRPQPRAGEARALPHRTGTRCCSPRRGASSRSNSWSSASPRASASKAAASPSPGGRRSASRRAGSRTPSSPGEPFEPMERA